MVNLNEAPIRIQNPWMARSSTVLKAIGFGINLQPNAARELIELGLGEALAETAIETAQGDSLARTMPLNSDV